MERRPFCGSQPAALGGDDPTIGGIAASGEIDMNKVKDDRRVRYTKMVLKESFVRLLGEKDISEITIKEICDGADINRATFYAHYSNQYDLLRKIEDELFENISARLSGKTYMAGEENTIEMVERIFAYIKENAPLCKLFISERGDLDFQKKIMMLVYDKNIQGLLPQGSMTEEEAEYIRSFTITGCVGVIQKWLNDDAKKSTRSLEELLVKLTQGLSGVRM
jgi:AcrR family transcriptional regulator